MYTPQFFIASSCWPKRYRGVVLSYVWMNPNFTDLLVMFGGFLKDLDDLRFFERPNITAPPKVLVFATAPQALVRKRQGSEPRIC